MAQLIRFKGGRDLLSRLHNDFDRLLAPFDLQSGMEWNETSMGEWTPHIDVKEEEKRYIIHADIPGVKASDIDLNMESGVLTIKGRRDTEMKEEHENYLRVERCRGSFMRQISLPETVDQEHIEAKCNNGVLKIILPKSAQCVGRKIDVKED